MRVLFPLLAFLLSRRWLVAILAVHGAILWLMIAMPYAPAIERDRPRFGDEDRLEFDESYSHPFPTAELDLEHPFRRRGASLTGTIEEESNGQAVKITARPDEFRRERR